MIDRSIKWPLILGVVCALAAVFVMARLLDVELPLEAKQDPVALAARVLATLTDAPAAEHEVIIRTLAARDGGAGFWVIAAIVALFGLLISAKATTERVALRRARRRRRARLTREIADRLAAEAGRV